jgi:N-acetylmuramoyl-L-alanine amidase
MVPIKIQILSNNNPGNSITPIGVILHETATPNASAQNEFRYFNSVYRGASAHAFVDCEEIVQTIAWNKEAWHAGETANSKYIGVEMCHYDDSRRYKVYQNTIDLLVYLFSQILKTKVNTDTLMSHAESSLRWKETDHSDPVSYLESMLKSMDDVRKEVKKAMTLEQAKNLSPDDIIRRSLTSPDKWINTLNVYEDAAKAKGDLGAAEVFQWGDDFVKKIYMQGIKDAS